MFGHVQRCCFGADEECFGNLTVSPPARQQNKNFLLSDGEAEPGER
jgi:hypothetical protein